MPTRKRKTTKNMGGIQAFLGFKVCLLLNQILALDLTLPQVNRAYERSFCSNPERHAMGRQVESFHPWPWRLCGYGPT